MAAVEAAVGRSVRVRGVVRREKLGDVIVLDDDGVLCPDVRFADAAIGTTIEVEGTVDETTVARATVGPGGVHGQGVEGDDSRTVLRGCVKR